MSRAMTTHLDEFSLLRFVARDMNDIERVYARRHVEACLECQKSLAAVERLDEILTELGPDLLTPLPEEGLGPDDPFFSRPLPSSRPGMDLDVSAMAAAARQGGEIRARLMAAVKESEAAAEKALWNLDLCTLSGRYGLLFALDAARQHMAEGVPPWLSFARLVKRRINESPGGECEVTCIDRAVALSDIEARASVLSGYALLWSGDYEQSGEDLEAAYRLHARGAAAESSFAIVEMYESQRRSFLDRSREALILAERARATFELLGLDEDLARTRFAKGLSLSTLGREMEAVAEFRAALPTFAGAALWNAYASTVTNIGASLVALGKLDEARREFARALRTVAGKPASLAFLRFNLALLLLQGHKYAEAAAAFRSAATLFSEQGSRADSLHAELYEIEALARGGNATVAASMLHEFRERTQDMELTPDLLSALEEALTGVSRDPVRLTVLREQAEAMIRSRACGAR